MDYSKLGTVLKNARESAGYTQKDISDLLKLTPQNISSWERGKSKIDIDSLEYLCDKYGISFVSVLEMMNSNIDAKISSSIIVEDDIKSKISEMLRGQPEKRQSRYLRILSALIQEDSENGQG